MAICNSHPCELIAHCDFYFHFPNTINTKHFIMCLMAMCMSSLKRYLFIYFVIGPWSKVWCKNVFSQDINHLFSWQFLLLCFFNLTYSNPICFSCHHSWISDSVFYVEIVFSHALYDLKCNIEDCDAFWVLLLHGDQEIAWR